MNQIDLGTTPALSVDEWRKTPPDRKEVSLSWLFASILTGVTSLALMGGALYTALDGRERIALPPTNIDELTLRGSERSGASGQIAKQPRKTDDSLQESNRNVISLSVVTEANGKNIVQNKPFAFVNASLAQQPGTTIKDYPSFNPLDIFAESKDAKQLNLTATEKQTIYGAEVDGDVALKFERFPRTIQSPKPDFQLSEATVRELLHDELPTLFPQIFSADELFSPNIESVAVISDKDTPTVRITTENFTKLKKITSLPSPSYKVTNRVVSFEGDALLDEILQDYNTSAETIAQISAQFDQNLINDKEKRNLKLVIGTKFDPKQAGFSLERISLFRGSDHIRTVARSDSGAFGLGEYPETLKREYTDTESTVFAGAYPKIYDAIYASLIENKLADPTIAHIVRLFSFDLDYNQRSRPGDRIEIFYALSQQAQQNTLEESAQENEEVIYASVRLNGKQKRLYRFRTNDGEIHYYDENGLSSQKFLLRKPVAKGKFTSGFGNRIHPILRRLKLHTGVDWSAPRGTPIVAAGNGTIKKANSSRGYGRRVEIQHANGYVTTYSHMTRFAKNIKKGVKVSRGQIIGYVGSTGLSTGPHLHYEVLVNGKFQNPLRIRVPRERILKGEELVRFEKERDRINKQVQDARLQTQTLASSSLNAKTENRLLAANR